MNKETYKQICEKIAPYIHRTPVMSSNLINEIAGCEIFFKYDSDGNQIEWSMYNSDGSSERTSISKYDSNGNKVEESGYYSDGSLLLKSIYKYDSKNRIIESISYDLESKFGELQEIPEGKTIYQYEEY